MNPMKILITSDNHLGFKENDDIRGNDSFNTFEEILMIGRQEKIDFIIQGGDLFHDNRPSRYCIDRTIQLLNEYCTGKEKSKHKELLRLNKMSEHVSIPIPILAIHGNHDDPSGINRISTLNILHSAGLINYIGHHTTDKIIVNPVIVENVAIFAIGHIKDKILYSCLIEGRVIFNRPDTSKKYYNILILHQNRVPRNKEHIPESLFDDFFDLIVYGHEHDNNITKGRSIILQSGSTVRTSLCESETGEKYCYILEVHELNTKTGFPPTINKIRLFTVRNFLMDTVKLDTDNLEGSVEEILHSMIKKSIQEFENRKTLLNETKRLNNVKRPKMSIDSEEDYNTTRIIEELLENQPTKMLNDNLKLPLIRLRVETTGLKILNNHRLGLKFTNLVANPSEMIRFIRKRATNSVATAHTPSNVGICDMVRANLASLGAILGDKFIESLEKFTIKDEKDSFNELIKDNVDRLVSKIDLNNILIDDLENEIKRINKDEEKKQEVVSPKIVNENDVCVIKNTVDHFENDFCNTDNELILEKEDNRAVENDMNDAKNGHDHSENGLSENANEYSESEIKVKKVIDEQQIVSIDNTDIPINNEELQLESLNSLSFISEDVENKDIKNESFSRSNVSYFDTNALESILSTKQSFTGKNSKEARKMLNSMKSDSMSNISYLSETIEPTQKEENHERVLFEEKQNTPEEESSTDLLFDF